jgi:hypothetical protein
MGFSPADVLDSVQANIFVTDPELNLVYLNDKARNTLRTLEPQLRQGLGLGPEELVGASLYRMHADRAALQRLATRRSAAAQRRLHVRRGDAGRLDEPVRDR